MRSVALLCCAFAGIVLAQNQLFFQIASGDNDNFFLRDNRTTAQLLLTKANSSTEARRLVVALPAGNSGALTYFVPSNNTSGGISVSLQNDTFKSTTGPYDNVGVQANLNFSGNATLGVTVIGAVRAMRGALSQISFQCDNSVY